MKSHGIEMIGTLKVETISTLPTWTSNDKGREIYVEDEDKRYYGDNTKWVKYSSVAPSGALLLTSNEWKKTQYSTSKNIYSIGGILTWNLKDNQITKTTLTENTTLYVSDMPVGLGYYTLKVYNPGAYTLGYNINFYWMDNIPPIITPSGIDILTFLCNGRHMHGAALQNFIFYIPPKKGYIFAGAGTVGDTDEYDVDLDTWTGKSAMPSPIRYYNAASTILNKGYVYGGSGLLRDCDEYDPDAWISKTDLPLPGRYRLSATTILDKGYIFGGWDSISSGWINDTDEYVPDVWISKTNGPERSHNAASTINNKGYIYCGSANGTTWGQWCTEYSNDTWTSKTDAPAPARRELAASTINDKGYIYAGTHADRDCDEYTPDTWTNKTDLPSPQRWWLAASTINDKGYIYGGVSAVQDCDEYNASLDTWDSKTDIPLPARYSLTASTI